MWIESALTPGTPAPAAAQAPPPRQDRTLWIAALVVLLVLVAGLVVTLGDGDEENRSLALREARVAYAERDYAEASRALERARAAGADARSISRLEAAVLVGPDLDAAEALVGNGKDAEARARLRVVLARAPNDTRALKLAARLAGLGAPVPGAAAPPGPTGTPTTTPDASVPPPEAPTPATKPAKSPEPPAPEETPAAPRSTTPEPEKPSPARPRQRPAQRWGSIRVESSSPAAISLDGAPTGRRTPATLRASTGTHRIGLVAEDGRALASQTVRVYAQRRSTLSFATVERAQPEPAPVAPPAVPPARPEPPEPEPAKPAAAEPASAEPAPAEATTPTLADPTPAAVASTDTAPAPEDAVEAPVEAPAEAHGFLSVTSNRPSLVYIDGQPTGKRTPLWMHRVLAGRHVVELRTLEGAVVERRTVTVEPKQMTPVLVRQDTPQ